MNKKEFDKTGWKIHHRSVTEMVLRALADVMGFMVDTAINRREVYSVLNNRRGIKWSKARSNSWVSSLSQRGYIEIRESEGKKSIFLTNKAKLRIIEDFSQKCRKDKIFRYISFDIPEKMRIERNKFRNAIKRMGFVQIQQSLWAIDRDVTDFVEMAAYEYKVENYIAYIISEKSDIDGIVEKKLEAKL